MKSEISFDNLQARLVEASQTLIMMATEITWNEISGNCLYVLSEIKNRQLIFPEIRAIRRRENDKKLPATLRTLMPFLLGTYDELYVLDLLIYKADKRQTIIEIQYFLKRSLEPDYRESVSKNPPMLHCKVAHPPYRMYSTAKFDINWERNSMAHRWNMLGHRLRYRFFKRKYFEKYVNLFENS